MPANRIGWRCFCRQHVLLPQFATVNAPDQNPLLAQLALSVVLRAYLEEEVHELLERLRFAGHDESYYVHEKAGLCVAVEHDGQDLLLCGGQPCCCSAAGRAPCGRRTMVSIFCSSLPFSRAVLSSLSEGTSAALSWCTYCCPSALRSSTIMRPGVPFVPDCTHSRGKSPCCLASGIRGCLRVWCVWPAAMAVVVREPSGRGALGGRRRWDATCIDCEVGRGWFLRSS